MGFLARLRQIQHALHEYAESIRRAEERKRNQEMTRLEPPKPLEVRAVVTYDQKTVTDNAAQDKRNHATQESIKHATWAAFYAVTAYALITMLMWCSMIKQNKIASTAMQQSTDTFRMDERAWVEIEPITASPISLANDKFPAGFSCAINLRNVGKTVATNIRVEAVPTSKTAELSKSDMDGIQRTFTTDVSLNEFEKTTGAKNGFVKDHFRLFSNPVPEVLAPSTTSNAPFRVSCQATQNYPSGGHFYSFIVGRIDYCDAFSIRHWKTFCFYVANAKGDVWSCENGNDEDSNSEIQTPENACGKPN